ncbi:MAG: hypothetical protein ABRQ39_30055, partial [Candidatus Eremiobacterota bacterium]
DVVVVSYEPNNGKWDVPTLLEKNNDDNSIKVITFHFSDFIGIKVNTDFLFSKDTGFILYDPKIGEDPNKPGQDKACIYNIPSLWPNLPSTGACDGFSIYSKWHFVNKSNIAHFFDAFNEDTTVKIVTEVHNHNSSWDALKVRLKDVWKNVLPHGFDSNTANQLYVSLLLTKEPQIVYMVDSTLGNIFQKDISHVILVYKWDNVGSKFIVYDSNFSGPTTLNFDKSTKRFNNPNYNYDLFFYMGTENSDYYNTKIENIFNDNYKTPTPTPATPPSTQEKIYFVRSNDIYTINPDGSNETRLTNSGKFVSPVLSPDGKKIVFVSDPQEGINGILYGKLGIANSDGSNIKIISNYDYSNFAGAEWFSDSQTFRYDKYIIDLNGAKVKEIPLSALSWPSTKLSPDGTKIVYATASQSTGTTTINNTVLVSSLNGTNTQSLLSYTTEPTESNLLVNAWAPNGKELAISMYDSIKGPMLWYVNLENNTKKLLINKAYVNTWTSDGKKIIYDGNRIINSDGTGDTQLVSGYYSCLSTDGKNMIYSSNGDMWVYNFYTQKSQKLTSSASALGWVRDGVSVVVTGQKISK